MVLKSSPDTSNTTTKYSPIPTLDWASSVLIRTEVGSTAHGLSLEGKDDYDEIGVFALPVSDIISGQVDKTIVYRPGRGPEERSQPGDYDLVVHSAQKFTRLAGTCNPSLLMVLYGPIRFSTPLGDELISIREAFFNRHAKNTFLGYATQQRERLEGIRGGKHTNRPELIEVYGFDVKYGYHLIRLLIQGYEYLTTAHITLPMKDKDRQLCLDIRQGKYTLDEVVAMSRDLEDMLKEAVDNVDIPAEPNHNIINEWLLKVFDWKRNADSIY